MTITRTDRMQQQQWSSGTDGPTRLGFNGDADFLESRAAYDDGTTGAVLPVTDVVGGRYFRRSAADGYELHRVQGSSWEWVGGSIVPTRLRYRRSAGTDIAWSTDVAGAAAAATMTAGGELATAGLLRSVAGGSAGADLATDLSTPAATGRWFVRTRATGERGVVAAAHASDAGVLFAARESGGTVPWTVDAAGRMRAQVPAAFGAATLTANVPLSVAPSATDSTALDLYARSSGTPAPALRAFPDVGDASPILSVLPAAVTLGRAAWPGGSIGLAAPTIGLTGAVAVTGSLAVSDDLSVTDDLTVGDQLSAEGGKVLSYDSGSNYGINSQVVLNGGGTAMRDSRQPLVWRKRFVNIDFTVSSLTAVNAFTFPFVPRTTCHARLMLGVHWRLLDPGSSGSAVEPSTSQFKLRVLDASDAVLWTGDDVYENTMGAFDTWDRVGRGQNVISECPPVAMTAGTTYKIQIHAHRTTDSAISQVLRHVIGTIDEVALLGETTVLP